MNNDIPQCPYCKISTARVVKSGFESHFRFVDKEGNSPPEASLITYEYDCLSCENSYSVNTQWNKSYYTNLKNIK